METFSSIRIPLFVTIYPEKETHMFKILYSACWRYHSYAAIVLAIIATLFQFSISILYYLPSENFSSSVVSAEGAACCCGLCFILKGWGKSNAGRVETSCWATAMWLFCFLAIVSAFKYSFYQ